jgi:hypothetical protein
MLFYGRKSYAFCDLNSLIETLPTFQPIEHKPVSISTSQKIKYQGKYENDAWKGKYEDHPKGITAHWPYGESEVYYSKPESEYYLPNT